MTSRFDDVHAVIGMALLADLQAKVSNLGPGPSFFKFVFLCAPVSGVPECGDLLDDAITSIYRPDAAPGQYCKLIGRPDGPTQIFPAWSARAALCTTCSGKPGELLVGLGSHPSLTYQMAFIPCGQPKSAIWCVG